MPRVTDVAPVVSLDDGCCTLPLRGVVVEEVPRGGSGGGGSTGDGRRRMSC